MPVKVQKGGKTGRHIYVPSRFSFWIGSPGEPVQGDLKEIGDPDQVIVPRALFSGLKTLILPKGDTESLDNNRQGVRTGALGTKLLLLRVVLESGLL